MTPARAPCKHWRKFETISVAKNTRKRDSHYSSPMTASGTERHDMKIGTLLNHPTLGRCKVIAVHPLGTIDVQNIYTDRCYRISGLAMVENGGAK